MQTTNKLPKGVFMKMFTILAGLLMSAAAFAQTSYVYHDYDVVLRGIAVNNACVTATTVESITPVRHCTKLEPVVHNGHGDRDNSFTDWVCTNWETSRLSYSRSFERPVCVEYSGGHGDRDNLTCTRLVQRAEFLPDTIKISTVTSRGERGDNFPGVSSNFTFPACK
jgi:hypothetical protein